VTESPEVEFFDASDDPQDSDDSGDMWGEHRPPQETSFLKATIFGLFASLAMAGIWAVIVGVTGFEIGYLAVGVGGLTGFAVAFGAGLPDNRTGILAVGLAVLGLIVAKVLIVALFLPVQVATELAKDPEVMGTLLYTAEFEKGTIAPETADWYEGAHDGEVPPDEITHKLSVLAAELKQQAERMSVEEREAIATPYAEALVADAPIQDRFDFSFYDLLWIGLAVGAAMKTGTGGELISDR